MPHQAALTVRVTIRPAHVPVHSSRLSGVHRGLAAFFPLSDENAPLGNYVKRWARAGPAYSVRELEHRARNRNWARRAISEELSKQRHEMTGWPHAEPTGGETFDSED